MPIVLAMNEHASHSWDDKEGVQYHYPNQYKNIIRPGESFVYYRGLRQKDGSRGPAGYFGAGKIGEVWIDPATTDQSRPSWYCSIVDYQPFGSIVPAKIDGAYVEGIAQNMFRNGVRRLSHEIYDRILDLAPVAPAPTPSAPVHEETAGSLFIPKNKAPQGRGVNGAWRRSRSAKEVGDWAELLVLEHIRKTHRPGLLIHRAASGETPGWDIDYVDSEGVTQRVEVKGTVTGAFTSFDLTINEYRAATEHGEHFWIALVARCLTDDPRIELIQNPAKLLDEQSWSAKPILFNISRSV